MPAPSASGFDLLCRNTTIATADRQQTNATTITALVVARMPKFIVGPQPVGTSRVFPQPARGQISGWRHNPVNSWRQDYARVAKLADARDLKSRVPRGTYRFDSGPGHHSRVALRVIYCTFAFSRS